MQPNNHILNEIFTSYAKAAYERLGSTDVEKLAEEANKMINSDIKRASNFKKVAFADRCGRVLAHKLGKIK